jgi:hypothetical protein
LFGIPGTSSVDIPGIPGIPGTPNIADILSDILNNLKQPATLEFSLINAAQRGSQFLDCGKNFQIVSADWLSAQFPEPRWVNYNYRWGPENTATRADPDSLFKILQAALGNVAYLVPEKVAHEIADRFLSDHVTDDVNGPVGPKRKKTWSGDYS